VKSLLALLVIVCTLTLSVRAADPEASAKPFAAGEEGIHFRSNNPNIFLLIVTHCWPGSN